MKVLFLQPYPTEGASNRYRVEQFLPYIKSKGIKYSVRPFYFPAYFKIRYKSGNNILKFLYFLFCSLNRIIDVFFRSFFYDVIFIHIEVFPVGPAVFEKFFSLIGKKIVFDFEDAIYLKNHSNWLLNCIKCPEKFFKTVSLSNGVIVCNNHLKGFLAEYNNNIKVIPTSINSSIFLPKNKDSQKTPVIGWIGSHSTLFCLLSISKVFEELAKKHEFILRIVGGGQEVKIPGVTVDNVNWTLKKDIENFQNLDIGVYPLPDNEWTLAKTPFKTIQYMSVGIPCVASNVGGNIEIIEDGVNGYLVNNDKEWFKRLEELITNKSIRAQIGLSGRKVVEDRYSLLVNSPKFLESIIK